MDQSEHYKNCKIGLSTSVERKIERTDNKESREMMCKDLEGKIIVNEAQVTERWTQHLENCFTDIGEKRHITLYNKWQNLVLFATVPTSWKMAGTTAITKAEQYTRPALCFNWLLLHQGFTSQ